MADEYEFKELNDQLKTFIKQMNVYMGFLSSEKKMRELDQANKRAKNIASGRDPDAKEKDPQKETNEYLKKYIELASKEERQPQKKVQFDLSKQSLKSFIDPASIAGSLSSLGKEINKPGKSVTGMALQTPGAILNLFKGMSKTREAKNIESGRKDINSLKSAIDIKLDRLLQLQKNPIKNKEEITKSKSDIETMKAALDNLTTKVAERLNKAILSREKSLGVTPSLDKKGMKDYNEDRTTKIKSSLFDDAQFKANQLLNRKRTRATTKTEAETTPKVKTNLFGSTRRATGAAKDTSRTGKPSEVGAATFSAGIFTYKIPITTTKPTTFGEVMGGLYYRVASIDDFLTNRQQRGKEKAESKGGFLGSLLAWGGLLLANIKALMPLITKAFGMLASKLGSLFKNLAGSLLKNIGGFFTKNFPKTSQIVTGVLGKLKGLLPGASKASKAGSMLLKGGGIAAKGVGFAAKRLPLIGTLLAAGTAAAETKGPIARKASAGTGAGVGSGIGIAGGAAAGAFAGSLVLPVIGTAVGGILGAILGGVGGEKLGKFIGTGVFDAFKKKKDQPAKDSGKVENILQNQNELQRTKDMSVDQKVYETAMYNALKRATAEDLDQNEAKRSRMRAGAMFEEANR